MSNTPPFQAPVDPNNPGQQQQQPNQNWQQQGPQGGFPPYNQNPFMQGQLTLPNATSALVCGIIGLVLCWNLIGLILNIVAVVLGSKAVSESKNAPPGRYTEASMSKARAGRVCGLIGLGLEGLAIIIVVIAIAANA